MVTVTKRISQVKQPRGGYINPKDMTVRYLSGDGPALIDQKAESIHASLVGLSVDYLTRLASGATPETAFEISLFGARLLGDRYLASAIHDVESMNPGVVDRAAIIAACRLSGYDVAYRVGPAFFNPEANTTPDEITIQHIGTMVDRSINFFREYGPVMIDGFTMHGGYTETVNAGDGDFLTADTLWDFKVSVNPPTSAHTLQLLMYWCMARQGGWHWHAEWPDTRADIHDLIKMGLYDPKTHGGPIPTHLGVYNPRLDAVYRIAIATIPADVIAEVCRDVIVYV